MDIDDLEPLKRKPTPMNLEIMSLDAPRAYIADLENLYVKYAGIHQNMIGYTDWPIEAVEAEPPAEEAAEE